MKNKRAVLWNGDTVVKLTGYESIKFRNRFTYCLSSNRFFPLEITHNNHLCCEFAFKTKSYKLFFLQNGKKSLFAKIWEDHHDKSTVYVNTYLNMTKQIQSESSPTDYQMEFVFRKTTLREVMSRFKLWFKDSGGTFIPKSSLVMM